MSSSSASSKSKSSIATDSPIEVKQSGTQGGNGSITVNQKDYDALVQERDMLKVNLYVLGDTLRNLGFQISDSSNMIQKIGNDLLGRIKLTPEQIRLLQQQSQQSQPQQQQQ